MVLSEPATGPVYDAFVSYRRSDGAQVARWLRRELEGFRLPRSLRQQYGRKLRIYLDTAFERGTSDFYQQSIQPALLASRFLLVVATPDAIRRADGSEDWIQREVVDFTSGPNGRNVIAIRAAGEFADPLPADLAERFPNIEIVDLRGASRLWFVNPARASRLSSEKLKLVAPLFELPADAMPRLRQEEERRQQARLGATAGVSLAVLSAVSATSIYALRSSFVANRALEDSMFATGRMIITAQGAKGEARSRLLSQGCDMLDKLGSGASSKPGMQEVVICGVERAQAHEVLGEVEKARAALDAVVSIAEARYDQQPRQDVAMYVVAALQAIAEHLVRTKAFAAAEAAFAQARDRARALLERHDRAAELAVAEGEGAGRLGDLLARRNDHKAAEDSFLAAAGAVARSIEWDGGLNSENASRRMAWQARLFRLAGEQSVKRRDVKGALVAFERSLETSGKIVSRFKTHAMALDAAYTGAVAFAVGRGLDRQQADKLRSDALQTIERVLAAKSAGQGTRRRAQRIRDWIVAKDATGK